MRARKTKLQRGNGVEPGGAGAVGLASLETGPAGATQDQTAIAVTNTAPATMAATASANTRMSSFNMAWNRCPAGRIA